MYKNSFMHFYFKIKYQGPITLTFFAFNLTFFFKFLLFHLMATFSQNTKEEISCAVFEYLFILKLKWKDQATVMILLKN